MKQSKKGAPIIYDKKRHPGIVLELSRDGYTNREIAKRMGVATDTLARWRKSYPEFDAAISEGKAEANQMVVQAIYKRAIGYNYTKKEDEVYNNNGKEFIKHKETEMHVPADPVLAIFYITNRDPENWKRHNIQLNFEKSKGEITELFNQMKEQGKKST